jgi:hypothetical protein
MQRRRASDGWRGWVDRAITLVAVAIAGLALYVTTLEREKRTDQICRIDERKQQKDIRQLERTYGYLLRELRAGRMDQPLNVEILRGLQQTEADAREDDAPPFCDEEGVGLPEPDPVVPDRPLVLL